jgi:predicted regulator of amino acid metabolism with ACT domain
MANIREIIEEKFSKFPSQKTVILKLMEYGLEIKNGKIYCNDIEQDMSSVADSCRVDARVVKSAVENIERDPHLSRIFSKLKSTLHLGLVAPELGFGEIVVEPFDAKDSGIIYWVAETMWRNGISIRQAIGDDPDFTDNAKLYVITDSPIPPNVIPEIKKSEKIKGVTIY